MALTYHSKVNAICVLISLLGKFRIAEQYRAEPVTIGFSSSKNTGRSTDPTIVVPYDASAFPGKSAGYGVGVGAESGATGGNMAGYPFTGTDNTYVAAGIGAGQQAGWGGLGYENSSQEERDRIEPVRGDGYRSTRFA